MADQSLKNKTIKGVGWSAVDNISRYGISFVIGLVLARMLSPDEYGLIGILTIFISIFNAIVDSGFTNALIRKQNVNDDDYSTVFYVNFAMSVLMAVLLFASAGLISNFFGRTELFSMTRVMSCVVVINALSIVQKARLTKAINFKTQTKITIVSTITSGFIGILLAYQGFGVWSLVWQHISSQLLNTLLLWFANKWIPKRGFNVISFREMWSFGWKLLVSKLLDTAWQEVYQVIIGKYYSPSTLGLFTRAKQFSDLCSSNLTVVVQRVSYPVLSSIQNDKERLKLAYKRVIKTTMLPTFVLMIGMASTARNMIPFLIGEKWIECVPMLQLICLYGMFYPLHAINLNMLQVQGRSDLFLKLEIYKKVIAIIPLLLGIYIGIYWMLIGTLLTNIVSYFLNAYYSGPFLNYSIKEQILDIMPSFGVALSMVLPIYAVDYLSYSPYILFPLQVLIGSFIVVVLCEMIKIPEYIEIKEMVMPSIENIFKKDNRTNIK